ALDLEDILLPAEGQERREIPVGAGELDRHRLASRQAGVEPRVDEGQVDLGPGVVRPPRGSARGVPGWDGRVVGPAVTDGTDRLVGDRLAEWTPRARDRIDGVDFRGQGILDVGDDAVLELGLPERDGLGDRREQVDDGGAAESKMFRLNGELAAG